MSMRIVPLLIAGFVGLLIGWLLGPDIDEVREDVAARLDAQLPQIAALQNGLTGLEQRIAAVPSPDQAIASLNQRLDAMQATVSQQADAIAARVQEQSTAVQEQARQGLQTVTGEVQQQLESLQGEIAALSARLDEQPAQPSAPAEGVDEATQLASEIGATGAVLLPGQAALFGGGRVDLISLDAQAGTAVLRAEGGEEATVEADASVEVTPSCTVRLAGVAGGAAYLMPEECSEPAAQAPADAATAQPATETEAEAPAAQPQDAAPAPAPPANGAAPAQDAQRGSDVPAQGAQAVPNQPNAQQPGAAPAQ